MHLKMQQERTELELDQQKKLFSKSMDSAKNLQQRATEAEKEVVTCRGHALSITKTLLDSLQDTKWDLVIKSVDTCYSKLEGIDDPKKAEKRLCAVRGYLSQQSKIIDMFHRETASNAYQVQQVISDMEKQIPLRINPVRVKDYIVYVRDLKSVLEDDRIKHAQ
ncbi:hypothetical protein PMIN03_012155 [Paraphaeosphaeria minitans]